MTLLRLVVHYRNISNIQHEKMNYFGYKLNMLIRILFLLLVIAFVTLTWFYSGEARSEHAVNDPRGACKCHALWNCKDKDGNEQVHQASESPIMFEDECNEHEALFCNDECPNDASEEEKNQICPCREGRFAGSCSNECSCTWDTVIN